MVSKYENPDAWWLLLLVFWPFIVFLVLTVGYGLVTGNWNIAR